MKKISLIIFLITGTIFNTSFSQELKYDENGSPIVEINKDNQLQKASKAVSVWTNNLKTGKYHDVYSGLSPDNKAIYDSTEWIHAIENMMMPFGDLLERKEISKKFSKQIEGIEESGYYVTFKYICNYTNTLEHSEKIIMKQDHKRKWRVLLFSYDFYPKENYKE